MKNKLRGQLFLSAEEALMYIKNHVKDFPQSKRNRYLKKMFERIQKYIDYKGEYFQ